MKTNGCLPDWLKGFLGIMLCLFSGVSFACSPLTLSGYYRYVQQGNLLLYTFSERESEADKLGDSDKIISRLAGINPQNFRRVRIKASQLNQQQSKSQWRDQNFEDEGFSDYFTDGQSVVYQGEIMQNAPDKPPVDALTFEQGASFGFAYDRYSTYSKGKRAGENPREHPIDSRTLDYMPKEEAFLMYKTFIYDANNLFSTKGVYLGSAKGLEKIASSAGSMTSCGEYYSLIYRTEAFILFNQNILDADPVSFQIIQWDGNDILYYRDKNGTHRFPEVSEKDKSSSQSSWTVNDARYCAYGAEKGAQSGSQWFTCQPPPPAFFTHSRALWIGGLTLVLLSGFIVLIKRRNRWIT